MNWKIYILDCFGILIPFVSGTICLFFPYAVQRYVIKDTKLGKFNPFLPWMKSISYIVFLRLMGLLFILYSLVYIITIFY
jgi:hypothetical protein